MSGSDLIMTTSISSTGWSADVPSSSNYGASAKLTVTLNNQKVGTFNFTPYETGWSMSAVQGNSTLQFKATYSPPAGTDEGTIILDSMTLTQPEKPNVTYSGQLFAWTSIGTQD